MQRLIRKNRPVIACTVHAVVLALGVSGTSANAAEKHVKKSSAPTQTQAKNAAFRSAKKNKSAPKTTASKPKVHVPKAAKTDDEIGNVAKAVDVTNGVKVEDIVETPVDFHYVGKIDSDPFLPPMVLTPDGRRELFAEVKRDNGKKDKANPIEIPIVSPLQRYDLAQLEVVGIWQLETGERKAMVMSPAGLNKAGQGIIVKRGDPIGKRGGKIVDLKDEFLTVREFILAPDGSRRTLDKKLHLGKPEVVQSLGKIRFTPGEANTEVVTDDEQTFEKLLEKDRGKKPNADGKAEKRVNALPEEANVKAPEPKAPEQPAAAAPAPAATEEQLNEVLKKNAELQKMMEATIQAGQAAQGQAAGAPAAAPPAGLPAAVTELERELNQPPPETKRKVY